MTSSKTSQHGGNAKTHLPLKLRLRIALCRIVGHRWSPDFDNGRSIGRYCRRCLWTHLRGASGGWSTEWRDLT